MAFISVTLMVSLALLGRAVKGKWFNLLTAFAGLYAVLTLLPSLRLYGFYAASSQAYFILCLGVGSFALGYLVVTGFTQRQGRYRHASAGQSQLSGGWVGDRIVMKMLLAAMIVLLAFYLYRFFLATRFLRSGFSFRRLRTLYFSEDEEFGRSRIQQYLFSPLFRAVSFLCIIVFFDNMIQIRMRSRIWLLAGVFFGITLMMFTSGGRSNMVYTVVSLLYYYGATRPRRRTRGVRQLSRRQKRFLRVIMIALTVGVLSMTLLRSRSGQSYMSVIVRSGYVYLSGWLPNMSIRLEGLDMQPMTHGYAYILGLIKAPAAFLHRVFRMPTSTAFSVAEALTSNLQRRVMVGTNSSFNAYVSLFYYFYSDFGYMGVVLGSMLFGGFCGYSERRMQTRGLYRDRFLYIMCFFLIICSMVRWGIISPPNAMLFYYMPLFFRRNKRQAAVITSAERERAA